jgi:hypothetical protein
MCNAAANDMDLFIIIHGNSYFWDLLAAGNKADVAMAIAAADTLIPSAGRNRFPAAI